MAFKDDLKLLIGKDEFEGVWNSFFKTKNIGFFINLLKCNEENVLKRLNKLGIEPKKILPNFYLVEHILKDILTHSDLFNNGEIYIQNPSSFLAPFILNPSKNDFVLDMCASPGGKSIALANLLKGGYLAAMEVNKQRFFLLKSNLKKYGCDFVHTYNKDARSIAKTCPQKFDKILLDTPCSSYSKFNDSFKEKSRNDIKALCKLQKQLLNSALVALKSGGEMVYSTCTFYKEENEDVILNALNSKFNIKILPIDLNLPQCRFNKFGLRIIPDDTMNAFFMCKIMKI